jgi:hypothetical protein
VGWTSTAVEAGVEKNLAAVEEVVGEAPAWTRRRSVQHRGGGGGGAGTWCGLGGCQEGGRGGNQ